MNSMYVWEVKEDAGYDGILWSVLIKDDENALSKIRKEVEYYYSSSIVCESDKQEGLVKIESVVNLDELELDLIHLQPSLSLPFGYQSSIEISRVKVL